MIEVHGNLSQQPTHTGSGMGNFEEKILDCLVWIFVLMEGYRVSCPLRSLETGSLSDC